MQERHCNEAVKTKFVAFSASRDLDCSQVRMRTYHAVEAGRRNSEEKSDNACKIRACVSLRVGMLQRDISICQYVFTVVLHKTLLQPTTYTSTPPSYLPNSKHDDNI